MDYPLLQKPHHYHYLIVSMRGHQSTHSFEADNIKSRILGLDHSENMIVLIGSYIFSDKTFDG